MTSQKLTLPCLESAPTRLTVIHEKTYVLAQIEHLLIKTTFMTGNLVLIVAFHIRRMDAARHLEHGSETRYSSAERHHERDLFALLILLFCRLLEHIQN